MTGYLDAQVPRDPITVVDSVSFDSRAAPSVRAGLTRYCRGPAKMIRLGHADLREHEIWTDREGRHYRIIAHALGKLHYELQQIQYDERQVIQPPEDAYRMLNVAGPSR